MLYITIPSGVKVRLPYVGEAVQVRFPEHEDWGTLPALVARVPGPVNDSIGLDLVIFNQFTAPTKVHFRDDVPYDYAGFNNPPDRACWRHIPLG